jgi:endo-1,4-beta-xylanase
VVNEAVAENGTFRQSQWRKIIGPDYLIKAYQFAHEADPQAELYYNDYGLENPQKRAGGIQLVKELQAAGVKLTGVGLQGHYKLDANYPTAQEVDDTINAFSQLGLKVMITELDIDVLPSARQSLNADVSTRRRADRRANPFPKELSGELQGQLAARYAEIFAVFLKHRRDIDRVTFWGVTDDSSWLNDWPIVGRTSYPLLFDRAGKPKPAFDQIIALTHPAGRLTQATDAETSIQQKLNN